MQSENRSNRTHQIVVSLRSLQAPCDVQRVMEHWSRQPLGTKTARLVLAADGRVFMGLIPIERQDAAHQKLA